MDRTTFTLLAVTAAAFTFVSCASEKSTPGAPLSIQDSANVVVSARVEALDYSTRRITLRTPSGHATTFIVRPEVQRLNEVAVGDSVKVEYSVSVEAELRPPTAAESASPISIVDVVSSSPQETDPSGSTRRRVRVVTTVEAVDLGKMLVTLKGPMGDTTTVHSRNQENIRKLHVGDTIVISYVENSVISLVKAPQQG
jgi:hypothetical protein